MKKSSKILSLALCAILLVGTLSACGGEEKVHTGDAFTYWVPFDNSVAQTLQGFGDLMMFKEMEKITGTKIEFLHPSPGSTGNEAFQVLLAAGEYPDMVEHWWSVYPGGGDQAVKDGIILRLNDYMEEYAPNYYDLMEGKKAEENGFEQ